MRKSRPIQLNPLFDKLPPHSPEAEAALLGSIILDSNVLDDLMGVVSPDSFYQPKHGTIYDALAQMHREGGRGDMVRLNELLRDRGVLDEIGGVDYLVELAESVPTATSAGHYAKIVQDKATLRKLAETAGQILHSVYTGDHEAADQLDQAQQMVFELGAAADHTDPVSDLHTLAEQVAGDVEQLAEHGISPGIPTGFHHLDAMLDAGGVERGQVIVIGARPSMGKSAFAINVLENMAMAGHRTALFSIEMSGKSLAKRMLTSISGVSANRLRRPQTDMNESDWDALHRSVAQTAQVPLKIVDTPHLSLERLTALSRKLVAREGVEVIAIDYLGIMEPPERAHTREQEVSILSRGIKSLARSLNVPILLLSQLNRESEKGGDNPGLPRLSHLRASGSIEQDADTVLFIHRDDYYGKHVPGYQNDQRAIINVAKQRSGPLGNVELYFDGERTRFHNPQQRNF